MQKDLKTGMIAGTVLIVSASLLFSVFSSSIEERAQQEISADSVENTSFRLTDLQSTTSMSVQPQVETQTRKKPSDKFLEYAQIAGMVIILMLMVLVIGNDIFRLWKG